MISEFSDFFERVTALELFLAVVFATAVVALVNAVVRGLVFEPLVNGGDHHSSWSELTIAVHGRAFDFLGFVPATISLTVLVLLAIPLIRRSEVALWDDRELRECPHCLSEIPAAAAVCSYCTRDVA